MNTNSKITETNEKLVFPEIEKYLARKIFPEMELPKNLSLNDKPVIFDIGACEGEDSIR